MTGSSAPDGRLARIKFAAVRAASVLALGLLLAPAPDAAQAGPVGSFLTARQGIAAPAGFGGVCAAYGWACARSGKQMSDEDMMRLAREVNRKVNASVHPITDSRQYGSNEVWSLPTRRGGDCEDYALMKKMLLVSNGVQAHRLLIANVLDRNRKPHAVLILRTHSGDLVLDNLRSGIVPWHRTGYSFLRMQNPEHPSQWVALLAGGIFPA